MSNRVLPSFKLDMRKAIEASALLLRLENRRVMTRKRLLVLLYLADRESLKKTGRPIVGGRLSALDFGPIHSEVYNLLKGSHSDEAKWSRHFQNEGREIKMVRDIGPSALSKSEVSVLHEISTKHISDDVWELVKLTHKFSEYKKNYRGEGTSTPIPFIHLIEAVDRKNDKDKILKDADDKAFFDKLFASPK